MMLDSDLAKLYGCKNGTKRINEIVKRNIDRFPKDFYFQLTNEEYKNLVLKSQTVTSKLNGSGGLRKMLHVLTEQGVAMLATALKTANATKVSIEIMRTFVFMRKFINDNNVFKRITTIEYKMLEYDDNFDKLFNALESKKIENEKIFFNGEIYDTYSLIIDLISEANEKIILIDNYIDKSVLDMLVYKKEGVDVLLVTSSHYLTNLDVEKFNKQYPNLKIKYSNIFHDRFIIIDNTLYHVGASFKDLDKKCFGTNKIEDKEYLNKIIEIIS